MRERIRLGKEEAVDKCCDDMHGVRYAINKTTKEHLCVENDSFPLPDDFEYVEADPEGWIPWNGDPECPLPEDAIFSYRMKNGETVIDAVSSCKYRWHHDLKRGSDIVAYKPLPNSVCEPEYTTRDSEWAPKMYEPIEVRDSIEGHWEDGVFLCHHDCGAVVSVSDVFGGFDYLWVHYSDIRPASSDEEKAVNEMLRLAEGSTHGFPTAQIMVERIYAGIREVKVTGVILTGGKE